MGEYEEKVEDLIERSIKAAHKRGDWKDKYHDLIKLRGTINCGYCGKRT